MSESGIEVSDEDRLEQVQHAEPAPGLAEEVGPEPAPVTAEQLAAGRDADPAATEPDESRAMAQESHEDAGPQQEHPE